MPINLKQMLDLLRNPNPSCVKTLVIKFFFFSFLIASTAFSQEIELNSDYLSSKGNTLYLDGNVKCFNALGNSFAGMAKAHFDEKIGGTYQIELFENVNLQLPDGSDIFCDTISLDILGYKGNAKSKEGVIFKTVTNEKPLQITCNHLTFQLKNKFELGSVSAIDDVEVVFDNSYLLIADQMQHYNMKRNAKESFAILDFIANTPYKTCSLFHNKDKIDAKRIYINTLHNLLRLKEVNGLFSTSLLEDSDNATCRFSSDYAVWDRKHLNFSLNGNILIDDSCIGTIDAKNTLKLEYKQNFEKTLFYSFVSKGPTSWKYEDPNNKESHHFNCSGSIRLDNDIFTLFASSPKKHSSVLKEDQLFYENDSLLIYAEEGLLEYIPNATRLKPTCIKLSGNIRLYPKDNTAKVQCGLADNAIYYPLEKKLFLSALDGNRVLLWHKTQKMKMSAETIEISQNTQKEIDVIKGHGNVRFTFNSEEEEKIKSLNL